MSDSTHWVVLFADYQTWLAIVEHTTDTSGYTEILFALFDLLGLQFSPRISDISR